MYDNYQAISTAVTEAGQHLHLRVHRHELRTLPLHAGVNDLELLAVRAGSQDRALHAEPLDRAVAEHTDSCKLAFKKQAQHRERKQPQNGYGFAGKALLTQSFEKQQ